MYLQLAETTLLADEYKGERTGYTWAPYEEGSTKGAYVRNDLYRAALKYTGMSEDDLLLSGFFKNLWNGIKKVAGAALSVVTGGAIGGTQSGASAQPIEVKMNTLPPGTDDGKILGMPKQTAMIVGAGAALALILMMKKK